MTTYKVKISGWTKRAKRPIKIECYCYCQPKQTPNELLSELLDLSKFVKITIVAEKAQTIPKLLCELPNYLTKEVKKEVSVCSITKETLENSRLVPRR